eukprot:Pgem_evm1s18481
MPEDIHFGYTEVTVVLPQLTTTNQKLPGTLKSEGITKNLVSDFPAIKEAKRDFQRNLVGNSLFLYTQSSGKLCEIRSEKQIKTAIENEADGKFKYILNDDNSEEEEEEEDNKEDEKNKIKTNFTFLQRNITVTPALNVAVNHGIMPSFQQPRFVIVVGKTGLFVLTYAFIGSPISGEQLHKYTPFCLRLQTNITDNGIDKEFSDKKDKKDYIFIKYSTIVTAEKTMNEFIKKD